jgi:hypothetical protein
MMYGQSIMAKLVVTIFKFYLLKCAYAIKKRGGEGISHATQRMVFSTNFGALTISLALLGNSQQIDELPDTASRSNISPFERRNLLYTFDL